MGDDQMTAPIIHGPDYSTYARTVRLALEEKGTAYELRPIHILGGQSPAAIREGARFGAGRFVHL